MCNRWTRAWCLVWVRITRKVICTTATYNINQQPQECPALHTNVSDRQVKHLQTIQTCWPAQILLFLQLLDFIVSDCPHLLQPVDLAEAIQACQQQRVQVPAVEQVGVLVQCSSQQLVYVRNHIVTCHGREVQPLTATQHKALLYQALSFGNQHKLTHCDHQLLACLHNSRMQASMPIVTSRSNTYSSLTGRFQ